MSDEIEINEEDFEDYSNFDYERDFAKWWNTKIYPATPNKKRTNIKMTVALDYNPNYYLNDTDNFVKLLLDKYRVTNPSKDGVQLDLYINYGKTLFDLIAELKKHLNENAVTNFDHANLVEIYDPTLYFSVYCGNNSVRDVFKKDTNFHVNITFFGELVRIKKIYTAFRKKYINNQPNVSWMYRDSDGSIQQSEFNLVSPGPIHQEYYPFINDVKTLAKRFMDSTATILLLMGDPGTGKTSLIRDMLIELNESAITTYDEVLMSSDKLYIRFLNSGRNIVVLEDADTLLLDRERDDNRVMSKILNASDGLVSLKNKKFIFTCNLLDVDKIEHALVRPGRCFDIIKFRPLDADEAEAAAKKIGVEVPHSGKVNLSELFNAQSGAVVKKKASFGFINR